MAQHLNVTSIADVSPESVAATLDSVYADEPSEIAVDDALALRWCRIASALTSRNGESEFINRCTSSWSRKGYPVHATIEIIDRPSPVSAILAWRDPTSCSYGDQTWRKTVARRPGVCAVSGTTVRRGDTIFRPALRGARPSNANAMILATYIECPELMDH